jgi:hypothetical protein
LENPASCIGLLSGKDIQIVDFSPPEIVFGFRYDLSFTLYTPPTVKLAVFLEFMVKLKFGVVLDSKGIREAIAEENPVKALNSFAFKDTFDGVDVPLVFFSGSVGFDASVSAVIVRIGVNGGVKFTAEIDFYDPFPETSGGLVRPFELVSISTNPFEWFEYKFRISVFFNVYIQVGKCCIPVLILKTQHCNIYFTNSSHSFFPF